MKEKSLQYTRKQYNKLKHDAKMFLKHLYCMIYTTKYKTQVAEYN